MTVPDHQLALEGWAKRIGEAIRTGSIDRADRATLLEYSAWLAKRESTGPFSTEGEHKEACEVVRLHLLRVTLEEIERRSTIMQWCVVALTVASLIGTAVQVFYAVKGERRAQRQDTAAGTERRTDQQSASTPTPTPAPLQSSRQAASPSSPTSEYVSPASAAQK